MIKEFGPVMDKKKGKEAQRHDYLHMMTSVEFSLAT